jgi:hypothetical protein
MTRLTYPTLALAIGTVLGGCASHSPLHLASQTLDVAHTRSIAFSGTGRWYQFGQAPNPSLAWPPFQLSRYTTTIDYTTPAARVEIVRKQIIDRPRSNSASSNT